MRTNLRAHSVLITTLLLTLGTVVSAHDFWIEPSTFQPKVDEAVRIHLRVGERFTGDPVARNGARIERFVVVGPSGERPVLGRDGMDPAGLLRFDEAGIWVVGYRSKPGPVQLAADAFEQYLREEGLERIIDERAARKESRTPGREQFSRSVKSLLRSGGSARSEGYDRALGMTLEFVLDADPAAASHGHVPVRLLHDGRALSDALVVAYRKDPGGANATEELRARTGADGRVTLAVKPGIWLLKAVHMKRAAAGSGADWNSVWTALTFQVPTHP
jgi:uncharacterized GH25 family protein